MRGGEEEEGWEGQKEMTQREEHRVKLTASPKQ